MSDRPPDPSDLPRTNRPNPYAGAALFPLGMIVVGVCLFALFKMLGE